MRKATNMILLSKVAKVSSVLVTDPLIDCIGLLACQGEIHCWASRVQTGKVTRISKPFKLPSGEEFIQLCIQSSLARLKSPTIIKDYESASRRIPPSKAMKALANHTTSSFRHCRCRSIEDPVNSTTTQCSCRPSINPPSRTQSTK